MDGDLTESLDRKIIFIALNRFKVRKIMLSKVISLLSLFEVLWPIRGENWGSECMDTYRSRCVRSEPL